MTREQIEYLRCREVEAFFHEKLDLTLKGFQGFYSEYDVTHVNDRAVTAPITLGYCQFPNGAKLYISVDLSEHNLGTSKIEFDLNQKTLSDLHSRERRILFLDALQTAVQDRSMINAESITGQSFWSQAKRDLSEAIEQPLQPLKEFGGEVLSSVVPARFQKQYGDTIYDADEQHLWPTAKNIHSAVSGLLDAPEHPVAAPPEPIILRPTNLGQFSVLDPHCAYDISFSECNAGGIVSRYCTLTPVDPKDENAFVDYYEYQGIRLTRGGIDLILEDGMTLEFAFLDREREEEQAPTEEPEQEPTPQPAPSPPPDREQLPPEPDPEPEPIPDEPIREETQEQESFPHQPEGPVHEEPRAISASVPAPATKKTPQKFTLDNIPDMMKYLANNAWLGKNPQAVRVSSGDHVIDMKGYLYEPYHEQFAGTSSLSLDGEMLYGHESRSVGPEQTTSYQAGLFDTLEEALFYLRDQLKVPQRTQAPGKDNSIAPADRTSGNSHAPKNPIR